MMTDVILDLKHVQFSYQLGAASQSIITDLNLQIKRGEMVAIQGPSGSGKSTLFYLIGCLLRPLSGEVIFKGRDITKLNDADLALFRNQQIGFVFQQFHLLPRATVLQNILLPAQYPAEVATPSREDRERAIYLANLLGLQDHLKKEPNQLSGGQQQRVAIARALLRDVDLILADEPTGNLDSQNAAQVLELFAELNREGKTIVLITHDADVAQKCGRTVHFRDGRIVQDEVLKSVDVLNSKPIEEFKSPTWSVEKLYRSSLPIVMANIFRNRTKSMLTMLGVTIGVAAVLAMLSLGRFTKRKVLEGYEALGANKLLVYGERNWRLKATDPASATPFLFFDWNRDLVTLKSVFSEIETISPITTLWDIRVSYLGKEVSNDPQVIGVNQDYMRISAAELAAGNNMSPFHVERGSNVCILGNEYVKKFDVSDQELIGKFILMGIGERTKFGCLVIGTLKPQGSGRSWIKPGTQILMPYTTVVGYSNWWNRGIGSFAVTIRDASKIEETGKGIVNFFKSRYGKSGEFSVDSDSLLIAQMKKFLAIFTILLGSIAALSLIVGGIGIHNMMLVSVSDRLKEIGLRKAVGATSRSVRVLFLSESALLCMIAGAVGVLVGWGACQLGVLAATKVVKDLSFEWVFDPIALALSTASILIVGIVSGLKPALKAEHLSVIEALRSD